MGCLHRQVGIWMDGFACSPFFDSLFHVVKQYLSTVEAIVHFIPVHILAQ